MDEELLLFDRLNVIKDTINKYGEDTFYVSFSGGKDSTVVHHLVDMALPNNKIPRVFSNTGIEYIYIYNFVNEMARGDSRFEIIQPRVNIKKMLEEDGYPIKSKEHSVKLDLWQRGSTARSVIDYINGEGRQNKLYACPKKLRYQFTPEFTLKVSDKCCLRMKKEPFKDYERRTGRHIGITGIQSSEGGARASIDSCITFKDGKVRRFHPLIKVDEEWEGWFIQKFNIRLCDLYYPPFNFKRTGCKGCPYNLRLQEDLDTMEMYLPEERKQCEIIWKPVYDEYRRIGYRLNDYYQEKLF